MSALTRRLRLARAPDPMATLVAAGTPEKVVRIWDPRAGGGDAAGVHSVSKLVGHTDNIRALCLSEDGRYVRVLRGVQGLGWTWLIRAGRDM